MYLEETLKKILEKVEKQEKLLQLFIPDLTKKKEVMHFLGVTRQTFEKYLKEQIVEENKHYYLDDKNSMVFIPDAVIELKMQGVRYKRDTKAPASIDILNSMKIGA